MGLLNLASGASMWRGYGYYQEKKVISLQKNSDTEIEGMVSGSKGARYVVFLNLEHPRKSHCNCPHANGRRIICKHMVALYFSVFPKEAEAYCQEVLDYEKEVEQQEEKLEQAVISRISHMRKEELKEALLDILFYGPEWQYDRFIRDYIETGDD